MRWIPETKSKPREIHGSKRRGSESRSSDTRRARAEGLGLGLFIVNQVVLAHGGTARCKTRYMFALCEREFKAFRQVVCLTHTAFRRELSYLSREEPKQAKRYL